MIKSLFAPCLVGASALRCGLGADGGPGGRARPPAAPAQTATDDVPVGKAAGTFMIRGRLIGVIPEDNSSSTTIGGHVTTTAQPAPEVDLSYFFTDNIAAELIAASTRHNVAATGTAVG